jgi:transposase
MLADELDFVVGVDPHLDAHAFAVVEVRSGLVVFEASVAADLSGYQRTFEAAQKHALGRRAFAIEGVGSFGAGLARFLVDRGEQVFDVGRIRREHRLSGKTDALDAVRAARSVLIQKRPIVPRSNGEREALRALVAAREGAVIAKQAGLCQLRDLLITTPEQQRAAAADPCATAATPRSNTTRRRPRSRAARQHARVALDRATCAATDGRRA